MDPPSSPSSTPPRLQRLASKFGGLTPLLEESELNAGVKLNARESTNQRERDHTPQKKSEIEHQRGLWVEGGGGDG